MTSAEEVASALANILKKCNIETVNSDVVNVTSKGDGYLGLLWSAKVTTRDSSDKVLHLVLKVTNNALEAGDIISPQVFFRREAYVYEIVFPTFEKLQCAIRTKNAFTSYPKLYGTSLKNTKEMLVMEDLKMRGYQMWNRLTPMDKDHISRVMEEYGRFHALSYLLRDQKPLEFKQVTQSLDDVLANLISTDWVVVYESACIKVAEMLELNGYSKASEKIEQMKDEVMDILTSYAKKDDKYSVILHGDCWCNNIMFKYEVSEILLCRVFAAINLLLYRTLVDHQDYQMYASLTGSFLEWDHLYSIFCITFLRVLLNQNCTKWICTCRSITTASRYF